LGHAGANDLLRGAVNLETDLMRSQLTTLTSADIRRFERDGYVVVRQAFSRADGLAMERLWWRELEGTHGIRRDDRSSWRHILGDLKAAKRDPAQAKILTGRVRGVFDDLLGQALALGQSLRPAPRSSQGAVRCQLHRHGRAAQRRNPDPVRVTPPADPARTPAAREPAGRFDRHAQGPVPPLSSWLMALTGQAPSPADRIAAFMDRETIVDGVPLRVVELTGEAGDMVFCHPVMVHCVAPNRGTRPRFMRIKTQVLTHEGREQRNRQQRLPS
jgi:hypothetical protein